MIDIQVIYRKTGGAFAGIAMWAGFDFVHSAPEHISWHFWDQYSLGSFVTIGLVIWFWEGWCKSYIKTSNDVENT